MKTKIFLPATVSLLVFACLGGLGAPRAQAAEASAPDAGASPPPLPEIHKPLAEIRYQVGVHDMWVPDVDSHTYGVNVTAAMEGTLGASTHYVADGDVFLDFDQDHLDPDHIPVWWQLHFGLAGPISQSTPPGGWHFSWVADANTRVNTVSSIEREIRAIAGLALGGKFGPLTVEGRLGGGYFFLEIDDDVPIPRGYEREDLRNTTWVLSPTLEATLELGPRFKLHGRAQEWHDGSVWLETKYNAALDWDFGSVISHSVLELSVELTEYNMAVYFPANKPPGYLPVVPWDDDRLIKLSLNKWW